MATTLNQNPWAFEKGVVECRLVHLLGAEEDPREGKLSRIYRRLDYLGFTRRRCGGDFLEDGWGGGALAFWTVRRAILSSTSAGSQCFDPGLAEGISEGGFGPFRDVVVITDSFRKQSALLDYIIGRVGSATNILNS